MKKISQENSVRKTKVFKIKNKNDTACFAQFLVEKIKPNTVIGLIGDLGTGKTTLTKYIAKELGVKERISSPTFNIIKEYRSGRLPLFHFDAYRVSDGEELLDIGAEDYFYGGGVSVVEWADIVMDIMPEDAIIIKIEYGDKEEERIYRCTF